ncbi:MAG: hypothetical protein OET44_18410, partial [Gammaproteobacteria bacterium]|nr:hypothetical protein [Gammaproteobacteria bacterium]
SMPGAGKEPGATGSKPTAPFLVGTPRVHYGDLDLVDDEHYPDDWVACHQGKPFTGVAWEESQGRLTEHSMKDGRRHGRCVSFHANGERASDGHYQQDEPVGEVRTWYASGRMESYGLYDESSNTRIFRRYNEAGTLIYEEDEQRGSGHRRWYDSGELLFDNQDGKTVYYAPDGSWAMREGSGAEDGDYEYHDDTLYAHAHTILALELDLVTYPLYRWLHRALDRDEPRARELLFELIEHPTVTVAENALYIVGNRRYQDAIPAVRCMTQSPLRKDPRAGGFTGTTAELAETVLVKLTVHDEAQQQAELDALRQKRAIRDAQEYERARRGEARRRRVQRTWPSVVANFDETLTGELTLKSGEHIFDREVRERNLEYWHYYKYVVDGRTYRACTMSTDPQPAESIEVRYREKDPAEYFCE